MKSIRVISRSVVVSLTLFAAVTASRAEGTVTGWGACCGYDFGQVTPPAGLSNVVAVAAGSYFSLALKSDGKVVGWGANGSGSTGDFGQTHPPTNLNNVIAIAAGELHSLALTASGNVVAWGYNGSGQTNVPPGLSNVVAIAAGGNQSLALTASGNVVSWGDNSAGQRSIPASASNVVAIAAADYFNLALTSAGNVVGWGNNSYGQINIPVGLSNVVAIAAGSSYGNGQSFSLALTSDGKVVGWGGNNFGQISIPNGLSNVMAISAGWYHGLALKSNGTVVAWGAVGAPSFGQATVPLGLSNVVAIAGGNVHSLALIGKIPFNDCTPPPSGLMSWWQAENNAADLITGNSGILSNGVGFALGKVGNAFSFNGVNAHVKVPASANSNIGQSGAFTAEAWINPSAVDGFRPIIEWNDGAQDGVHFWFGSGTGILFANIRDTALNAHAFTSASLVVAPNIWQHVALTYDKATGLAVIYLNGSSVAQTNLGSFTPLTTADLWIGRRPGYGVYYAGLLDELSLYNRALGQNEIQGIYNAGGAGKCYTNSPPTLPVISTFDPPMGNPGINVTITGSGFSPTATNDIVYFGAVKAAVLSASSNSLTVTVPAGATHALITVTVNGMTAATPVPFLPTFSNGGPIDASLLAPRIDIGAGSGPIRVVCGDLDGDGKPDLVNINYYTGTVNIYRNTGTNASLAASSFSSPIVLSIPGAANNLFGLSLGDLDGDGRLDLLVAGHQLNQISIFQNLSTPGGLTGASFAARVGILVSGSPDAVSAADIDGDGRLDVITANAAANTVSILRNVGNGGVIVPSSFASPVSFASGPSPFGLGVVDLDGDGKLDLATANQGSANRSVSLFRNLSTVGNCSLAPAVDLPNSCGAEAIALGDLDGDAKQDIVIGCYNGQTLSVYRNMGTAGNLETNSFASPVQFNAGSHIHSIAIADLNGDGKPDVGLVSEAPDKLSIFQNTSTAGSFTTSSLAPRIDFPTGSNPVGISIDDLDGDGRPDIAFGNFYSTTIGLYRNVNTVHTAPTIVTQPTNRTVAVGGTTIFSVTATSYLPPSYQWQFNGTNILGATASSLTITNVGQTKLGTYAVVVSNPAGSTTSSNAVLTMYPYLRVPFGGIVVNWGQDAILSVDAGGSGPFSFQWYVDGAAIQDATNQTLTISSIQFTNAGSYSVVIQNPFGSVTNAPAQLVVNPAGVSIALHPGVRIDGTIGYTYGIQFTTDLSNTNGWIGVTNLTLSTPVETWYDPQPSTLAKRYYRVLPGPIPIP